MLSEGQIADLANNCGGTNPQEAFVTRYEELSSEDLGLYFKQVGATKEQIITELKGYSGQDSSRIAALVKKIEAIP